MITTLILSAIAAWLAAYMLPGVTIEPWWAAIIVAVVLGIINAIVRPIVKILTLPVTLLTLGLFILVINALMVQLGSWVLSDYFQVTNFGWAFLYSLVLSVITWLLQLVFNR